MSRNLVIFKILSCLILRGLTRSQVWIQNTRDFVANVVPVFLRIGVSDFSVILNLLKYIGIFLALQLICETSQYYVLLIKTWRNINDISTFGETTELWHFIKLISSELYNFWIYVFGQFSKLFELQLHIYVLFLFLVQDTNRQFFVRYRQLFLSFLFWNIEWRVSKKSMNLYHLFVFIYDIAFKIQLFHEIINHNIFHIKHHVLSVDKFFYALTETKTKKLQ